MISPLAEIVIRSGDLAQPAARQFLIDGYEDDRRYPNVFGLSVVFRQGAALDTLAKAASFPHGKIKFISVGGILDQPHEERSYGRITIPRCGPT
jgi:hypothetical protein